MSNTTFKQENIEDLGTLQVVGGAYDAEGISVDDNNEKINIGLSYLQTRENWDTHSEGINKDKFVQILIQGLIQEKRFFDGSGKDFQDIFKMIDDIVKSHPDSYIYSIDEAGELRSKNLNNEVSAVHRNSTYLSAHSIESLADDIEKFVVEKRPEKNIIFLIYFTKYNEPFTFIAKIFKIFYDNYIKSGRGKRISDEVLNTFQDNLPAILNGDLSSLGFDLYIIKREQ